MMLAFRVQATPKRAVPCAVCPPSVHVTVALATPGRRVSGGHVQRTVPDDGTDCACPSDRLAAAYPLAYTTFTVHAAPTRVTAVTVVGVSSLVGLGCTCPPTCSPVHAMRLRW